MARRGSHFGMAAPMLVQFEKEIDRDIAKDTGVDLSSSGEEEESLLEYGPIPQIITNDLRSLDERVSKKLWKYFDLRRCSWDVVGFLSEVVLSLVHIFNV